MHENTEEKTPYQEYQEAGGIINESDYKNTFERYSNLTQTQINEITEMAQWKMQAMNMAKSAGLTMHKNNKAIEFYGLLRGDTKPEDVQYHHGQMSDQSLFLEALRMSGDADSADKLIETYHKTGIHCPICLKVPAEGEECR
ncbi:MAG: hypothetical protein Q8P07_01525 [bacterium]|nr:hypothetical protein [bacterium]